MKDCIFCKICQKKLPAKKVFENKDYIAFYDINPKAPIHILILPKLHLRSINQIKPVHKSLVGGLFLVAKKIAKKLRVRNKGYKLAFNVGREGGQLIEHLHLHFLAGWKRKKSMENQKFP